MIKVRIGRAIVKVCVPRPFPPLAGVPECLWPRKVWDWCSFCADWYRIGKIHNCPADQQKGT